MAASEPQESETGQHLLGCGFEHCENKCQFYCNPCNRPLCEQCKEVHKKSPDTQSHEVVLYQQLFVEKCKDHPKNDIDSQIHQYFLPTSLELQKETREDASRIKMALEEMRASIMAEADTVKKLVDAIASEKVDRVNKIEESLNENLKEQDKTFGDYISYLHKLVETCHQDVSSTELQNDPKITPESIRPIPETTKPVLPVFTTGQYNKDKVANLLGSVNVSSHKPKSRKIKPLGTAFEHSIFAEKQSKEEKGKPDDKQTLSSSVTEVAELKVPNINGGYHMSIDSTSGKIWLSDMVGNLLQIDLERNRVGKFVQIYLKGNRPRGDKFSRGCGYHKVTQSGFLIYTDKDKKVVNRMTLNNKIIEIVRTVDWEPISVHSSYLNGDILVGVKYEEEAKVIRYNKTGQEIQTIQMDSKDEPLYRDPHYITENINGDICTSDYGKQAVVVVDEAGEHRFSYTGKKANFFPWGICVDTLGHILVCDECNDNVHLLDKNGEFLSYLFTRQQSVKYPRVVSLDIENNLYVGQSGSNTLTIYKYHP